MKLPRSPTAEDQKKFQEILDTVEPASLHEVLLEHVNKYKHGVYPGDKTAMQAVHKQNAEVASSLVSLVRRQESATNGTTTPPPPPPPPPTATKTEVTTTEGKPSLFYHKFMARGFYTPFTIRGFLRSLSKAL